MNKDLSVYQEKTILVTGHTGFKGSWLTLWLSRIGAKVIGISLDNGHPDGLFQRAALRQHMTHLVGDICDQAFLRNTFAEHQPEIVFHLAAQALVRESYEKPAETFHTNVLGTVQLLEAIRHSSSVRAAIMVTSDKCYKNKGWLWGYREHDELGGHDPYSASKACAELVIDAYRNSFFHDSRKHPQIASVRAGNVMGGGDWAKDRVMPDCIRALRENIPIPVRNPSAIRPWQHVLDPLSGYLHLAAELRKAENAHLSGSWNFGPDTGEIITVQQLVERIIARWQSGSWVPVDINDHKHEAEMLNLDCSKAALLLQWKPRLTLGKAIEFTVNWYKNFEQEGAYALSSRQIDAYMQMEPTVFVPTHRKETMERK